MRLFELATLAVGAVLLLSWLFRRSGGGAATADAGGAPPAGAGAAGPERVGEGDTVRIRYVGRFEDGHVFDDSGEEDPLEFTLGAGHVIPGMERAVLGMAPGETRDVVVPPEEAYGPVEESYMAEIDRSRLPAGELHVGMEMQVGDSPIPARIMELRGDRVLMDINHPLAGKNLHFTVTLLEIVRA